MCHRFMGSEWVAVWWCGWKKTTWPSATFRTVVACPNSHSWRAIRLGKATNRMELNLTDAIVVLSPTRRPPLSLHQRSRCPAHTSPREESNNPSRRARPLRFRALKGRHHILTRQPHRRSRSLDRSLCPPTYLPTCTIVPSSRADASWAWPRLTARRMRACSTKKAPITIQRATR